MQTFGTIAAKWHSDNIKRWSKQVAARISRHIKEDCTTLLDLPINTITAQQILRIAKHKEITGPSVGRRLLGYIIRIMDYAVAYGHREHNPARSLYVALMPRPCGAFAAIPPEKMPELFRAIETHSTAGPATKMALLLLMYTAVRRSEAVYATWPEIDLGKAKWTIPAARMKMRKTHIVPLATQVVSMLQSWMIDCPKTDEQWLFPGAWGRGTPIHPAAPLHIIHQAGYGGRMTLHGLRKVFSTAAHEAQWPIDVIEAQLAHKIPGVRGIYNHATYLPQRRELMQWYADTIDRWRDGN